MAATWLLVLLLVPALQAQNDDESTDTTGTAVNQVPDHDQAGYHHKQPEATPPACRHVPDSVAGRLQKQKDFAYANDAAYWIREPEAEEPQKNFRNYFYRFFSQHGVRMLLYGLLIAFFLFIIYRVIVVNNLYLFYKPAKIARTADETTVNITDERLDEKIGKAVDQKDHRMAVRYMYLKALRLLNHRQWIHFHAQATNYEYVNQMSGHTMGGEFSFLTGIYDYVWYGGFALTGEQFGVVHNRFLNFYNSVK